MTSYEWEHLVLRTIDLAFSNKLIFDYYQLDTMQGILEDIDIKEFEAYRKVEAFKFKDLLFRRNGEIDFVGDNIDFSNVYNSDIYNIAFNRSSEKMMNFIESLT